VSVPQVAYFYGITITMFMRDHAPPHFHAEYAGEIGVIDIKTGAVLKGQLHRTARRVVKDWAALRRDALMANWQRARLQLPLEKIEGPDDDTDRDPS
jgi:hypothetical protein